MWRISNEFSSFPCVFARERKQKEQRQAYLEQMKRLQESANRSKQYATTTTTTTKDDNNPSSSTDTGKSGTRFGVSRVWGWFGYRSNNNNNKAEE